VLAQFQRTIVLLNYIVVQVAMLTISFKPNIAWWMVQHHSWPWMNLSGLSWWWVY